MALTAAEEAQTRELLAQQAAILSLADSEAAIISNLGATDVSLSDLTAATVIGDSDLLLIRQGVTDKSVAGSIVKATGSQPDASETVKGIVELATSAETAAGISTTLAIHPAGLSTSYPSVVNSSSELKASATGTNALIPVTAGEIVVESSTGAYKTLRAVSISIDSASVGANGLDTGTIAAATWYAKFVIWNGTTVAGLLSLSSTSPTLPSGYTHKARTGWVRTDATANKYPLKFDQYGDQVGFNAVAGTNTSSNIVLATGVQGTINGAGVSVPIDAFIPPTAWIVDLVISNQSSAGGVVQVGKTGSLITSAVASLSGVATQAASVSILLDGTSRAITYASNISGGVIFLRGWRDNL